MSASSIQFSGHGYDYIQLPGRCEFSNPEYGVFEYDHDIHHDYDYAEEDKEQCLQSCLQKSRTIDHAVGCEFLKSNGRCAFVKSGTIVGSSEMNSNGFTCWRFYLGENYRAFDYFV